MKVRAKGKKLTRDQRYFWFNIGMLQILFAIVILAHACGKF